jgi:DNA-binding response OmpR family regulator
MIDNDRRVDTIEDRRAIPRGGRRTHDLPGRYPPVLVADAYEDARGPCAAYLTLFGFEVAEAAVPTEALALIDRGWMPRVILADPASAQGLSERRVSSPRSLSSRMIVMTSFAGTVRPRPGGVLVKPFHLSTMLNAVRRVLRRTAEHERTIVIAPS